MYGRFPYLSTGLRRYVAWCLINMKMSPPVLSGLGLGLLFALTPCALAQSADAVSAERPNILFICIDDFGDYTGFLRGHEQAFTPAMDRLAATGVTFTSAHATTPVCAPSRTAFMTGRSAEYTGIFTNAEHRDAFDGTKRYRTAFQRPDGDLTIYTLPEWLKDQGGYFTLGLGKLFHGFKASGFDLDWQDGNPDRCGRQLSWSDYVPLDPNSDPEPTGGVPSQGYYGLDLLPAGPIADSLEGQMMDTRSTNGAIAFLEDYAANPGNYCDRPFFLGVGYLRPHEPFFAPERYFSEFWQPDYYQVPYDRPYNDPPGSWPPNGVELMPQPGVPYADGVALGPMGKVVAYGNGVDGEFENYHWHLWPAPVIEPGINLAARKAIIADAQRAQVTMAYLASVRYVDAQIERLVETLEAHPDLARNTVVVLFSDHGFNLGQKRHWLKNALWDQVTRVPLVIRDPRVPGGRDSDAPASLLDLFPTLCELAGVPEPADTAGNRYCDGRSLVPRLTGAEPATLVPAITAMRARDDEWYSCYPLYSVHTGRYHGIRYRRPDRPGADCPGGAYVDEWELYDLGASRERDPHEWNNLAGDSAWAPMLAWMDSWLPGGALHGQEVPVIDVAISGRDCDPQPDDKWRLTASASVPLDSGWRWRWRAPDLAVSAEGPELVFRMAALPAAWFTDGAEITVFVELVDSTGAVLNMETVRVPVGPATDPGFTAALTDDGMGVALDPASDQPAAWSFGDGVTWSGIRPAPHRYTLPGTYIVTRALTGEHGCPIGATDTVTVADSAYAGTCLVPYPPSLLDAGPEELKVALNPVYGANAYALRWRPEGHDEEPWRYDGSAWVLERRFKPAAPETRVEVQVKSFCYFTTASGWSASGRMETPPCRPPFGLEADVTPHDAELRWTPMPEALGGQRLFVFEEGAPWNAFTGPPEAGSLTLGGLHPDTEYTVEAGSFCRDLGGTLDYKGRQLSSLTFRTLPPPDDDDRLAAPQPWAGPVMAVWPNPATEGVLRVRLQRPSAEGHAQASAPQTLRLLDRAGREVRRVPAMPGATVRLALQGLPAGTYVLEWIEAGLGRTVVVP